MSGTRRVARPSPSAAVAVIASGLVGSSTRVTSGDATSSPTRSANSDRPFSTFSPDTAKPRMARNCAVTNGSRTTVVRNDDGFVAPSIRVVRSAVSRAHSSMSSSDASRPMENQ